MKITIEGTQEEIKQFMIDYAKEKMTLSIKDVPQFSHSNIPNNTWDDIRRTNIPFLDKNNLIKNIGVDFPATDYSHGYKITYSLTNFSDITNATKFKKTGVYKNVE